MTTTWTGAQTWGAESRTSDLGGDVHWVDFGGPSDARRIVFVHGLGGSHLNWVGLAAQLEGRARMSALDLVGFGLSHSRGRKATVGANASLVERFIGDDAPVTLIGNSMGGLISALVASRSPELVDRLVLIDPALPPTLGSRPDPLVIAQFAAMAVPGLGERVLARSRGKATPEKLVRDTLALCCAHPERVAPEVIAASEALVRERASEPGLTDDLLAAARSLLRFNANPRRAWAMYGKIAAPTLLIHGDKDRLVPVAAARTAARRNPSWRFEELADVGHVPQVEVPSLTAELVLGFLA